MKSITVHRYLVLVLIAISFLFSATFANAECTSSDFNSFWSSVEHMHFNKMASGRNIAGDEVAQLYLIKEAKRKTLECRKQFDGFLLEFPVLCELNKMTDLPLNHGLFMALVHELDQVEKALNDKKLSPEYLVRMSFKAPLFTTNLIAHVAKVSDFLVTLEVDDRYLPYFHRIAQVLLEDSRTTPALQLHYYRLFSQFLLDINDGRHETLEPMTRTIEAMQLGSARKNESS